MRINILYLNVNSHLGGAERRLLSEVRFLDKSQFNATVGLFYRGELIEELEKYNIPFKIFPTPRRFLRLSKESLSIIDILFLPVIFFEVLLVLFRIICFAKRNKAKTIITYTIKMHIISMFLKLFTPYIIWQYCDLLPENKYLKKVIISLAKFIPTQMIVNSNFVRNEFLANRTNSKKITAVYDGFYIEEFQCSEEERQKFRKGFFLEPYDFAIGCLGALVKWKGQEYLIRSIGVLKDKIPNLKVLIVGGKFYDTVTKNTEFELKKLSQNLGLNNIIFTGFIRENRKILNALDVVVHTSIKPEPFGRVIVEAMLCGKPVIATRAGGALEIVRDNETGILVTPADTEALEVAIADLYKDEQKRKSLGEKAKKYAREKFSIRESSKKIESIYTKILS